MHAEIQFVEEIIGSLQQENENLKEKLIEFRKVVLKKYFMKLFDHSVRIDVFRQWKQIVDVSNAKREMASLELLRDQDIESFEGRIANLETKLRTSKDEVENSNQTIELLESEREDLRSRLAHAEEIIYTCAPLMNRYPLPKTPRDNIPASIEMGDYIKSKLHEILRDVDPRYLAPLPGPSVQEISLQERVAYQRGTIMHPNLPQVPLMA